MDLAYDTNKSIVYKKELELFLSQSESIIRNIDDTSNKKRWFDTLSLVNEYSLRSDALKKMNTSYHDKKIVHDADRLLIEAAIHIQRKSDMFKKTEQELGELIEKYPALENTAQKEQQLAGIMQLSSLYSLTTKIDPLLLPQHFVPDKFYSSLASLSFIADADLANTYLKKYAGCNGISELERFKDIFNEEFVKNYSVKREKLRQKYHLRKSSPKSRIIDAPPIALFRLLSRELDASFENREKLFEIKNSICKEITSLEAGIKSLDSNLSLQDDYLAKLVKKWPKLDCPGQEFLFVQQNLSFYQDKADAYYQLAAQKKEKLQDHVKEQLNQVASALDSIKDDPTEKNLKEKNKTIQIYKTKAKPIWSPELELAANRLEEKIARLGKYYSLDYQIKVEDLLQNIVEKIDVTIETAVNTSITPVERLTKIQIGKPVEEIVKRQIGKPVEKVIERYIQTSIKTSTKNSTKTSAAEISHPTSSHPVTTLIDPPLKSARELMDFAFEMMSTIKDPNLISYCGLVAGYEKGEFDLRNDEQRFFEARKMKLELTKTDSADSTDFDDFKIYGLISRTLESLKK